MDHKGFDRLAVVLGSAVSRRSGIAAAIGAAVGAGTIAAAAEEKPGKRKGARASGKNRAATERRPGKGKPSVAGPCGDGSVKDNTCSKNGQCCTGVCQLKHNGKKDEGRCRCRNAGRPCTEDRNCCNRGNQSLSCVNGRCGFPAPAKTIATGDACVPGDLCADANASCVAYQDGVPAGTYCLIGNGGACTADADCASETCENGACSAQSRSGKACATASDCLNPDDSCSGYTLGSDSPTGTYCVKPEGDPCSDDDECITGFCSNGLCEKCTVCVGGACDFTTINGATNGSLPEGSSIGIAPGTYDEAVAPDTSYTYRRCGSRGTVNWTQPADSSDYSLWLDYDIAVTVSDITFTPGGYPAIWLSSGSLTMVRVTVKDKPSGPDCNYGGVGTESECGILTIIDSTIENNNSDSKGGGIRCEGSKVTAINTVIRGNTVKTGEGEGGGGIFMAGCLGIFSNCTIANNMADYGGGYYSDSENTAMFDGCTFSGNSTTPGITLGNYDGRGGAILADAWNSGEILSLSGTTTVTGNTAEDGSGIASVAQPSYPLPVISGAKGRVSSNTGGDQCIRSADGGATWTAVPNCAF